MAATGEEICNQALLGLGESAIEAGSLVTPSSAEEHICAAIYDQIVADLLSRADWAFARKVVALSRNTAAPSSGYTSSFNLPTDCIEPRHTDDVHDNWRRFENELHVNRNSCTLHYTYVPPVVRWPAYFVTAVVACLQAQLAAAFDKPNTTIELREIKAKKAIEEAMLRALTGEPPQEVTAEDFRSNPFRNLMRSWSS